MNICLKLKKEEPEKITTTKELAQYILESGNDVEKMSEEDRSRMDAQITAKLQSGKKLSQKEMDSLEVAARLMLQNKTVPCNLCQYCMPCPYGIDIPGIFDCWNLACTEDRLPEDPSAATYAANRRRFLKEYDRQLPHLRQAEHCIGCGRCVAHCPQRIDIPKQMAEIDAQIALWRKEERHV